MLLREEENIPSASTSPIEQSSVAMSSKYRIVLEATLVMASTRRVVDLSYLS
jgi:hypothetical protein